MNEYNMIAGVYDSINSGVDYERWADFFEKMFDKYLEKRPELVLDLACGTGKMLFTLAKRGYDMIGVDGSAEMLSRATDILYEKIDDGEIGEDSARPLFLCQDMKAFELYGTVGATVSCLDSLNYLAGEGELSECFACVHNYLDPDGLFLFDMNTPYKFENTYGENAYVYDMAADENSGARFCVWQNFYDRESKTCDFFLTLFEESGDGRYERADEEQRERCYSMEEITDALSENGFELLEIFADVDGKKPEEDTERWYFVARCKKD